MKKAEVKKGKKKNALKEYWPLYLMMLPALLYLLINNYIPMAGMVIAFKKLNFAKGIWASPWAGLKNFKFLFASKDAWIITRNTLLYNVAFILVNMVVGIAIAILITEVRNTKLKKVYQSAILLPFLMSMVILSYIVYALLSAENGLVNNSILPLFHIDPIQWYQKPKYWPAILIIANCWKGVGYGCLIYIASLIGIDPSFYEAASTGRCKQMAGDYENHTAEPRSDHHHPAAPQHRKNFLFRFRSVLSGADELRCSVPDHKRYRYLRIPCPD